MSMRKLRGHSRVVVPLTLVAALGLGLAWQHRGAVGEEPQKKAVDPAALQHAEALSNAFNNAAEIAMPSVVTIRSRTKAHPVANNRPNGRGENPLKGTPFEDFFKGRGLDDMAPNQSPRREGMGSGVIIDKSGIVMTNNHVVDGADEVIVHLADGREFKGENIKVDEQTDLAIIRISGAGSLPAATLGNSDKLRIGDWVMAIGNPFEQEQSVSAGIISGLARELGRTSRDLRARFLQTDAAINPGNSGGPLINLHGEVVGINTAIATNTGSFNGIGFAIPINLAKWVTGQLIKEGSVQRAYLGISMNELTPELAEKLNARRGEGVLVAQVLPGTPAEEAGFEAGDIIVKFAGQKVHNRGELQAIVERTSLGSKQDVEILRDGKTTTLQVTTKALPKDFGNAGPSRRPQPNAAEESASYQAEELGIEVADISLDQANELGVKPSGGVVITKVDADKIGYDEGLREGMVIMKAGKKVVKNVEDFKAAIKGESVKEGILLHVHTKTGDSFVLVKE